MRKLIKELKNLEKNTMLSRSVKAMKIITNNLKIKEKIILI
jgi:hypothetical protein